MIVNGYEQYTEVITRMNRERCVLTPIFRDLYYHPTENELLCVGVTFEDSSHYTISVTHDDATKHSLVDVSGEIYVPNSKKVTFPAKDIASLAYINGILLEDISTVFNQYINETHTIFGRLLDINKVIPIAIWNDILSKYNTYLWKIIHDTEDKNVSSVSYMHGLLDVLKEIELSGLKVNRALLNENYDEKVKRSFRNDMVFTEYNPYTITGRPSNRFGGINFSALNKSDGTRDMFISRYPNGKLVQIDFEAYHLRLIAEELGVHLPSNKSIHTQLAEVYFQTEDITEDLYAESKRRTFEIMYGMQDETYGFELFEKIKQIRESYEGQSQITLPSGITVSVESPSANKLFNYYVQSLEVVRTLPKLKQVLEVIKNTNSHLVLYTYDSILLDVESFDTEVIKTVVDILEENKKFPVRVYCGTTYGSIEEIK